MLHHWIAFLWTVALVTGIDISFHSPSSDFEAIWRASNGQPAHSDISSESKKLLDNSVQLHAAQGPSACDAILADLNNPNPSPSQPSFPSQPVFPVHQVIPLTVDRNSQRRSIALCSWACALGRFDMSMAYVPGTLYTKDLGANRYVTIWQEACLPGPGSSTITATQPKWATTHNCRTKPDGTPWKGSDGKDTGDISSDMPANQAAVAKELAAQALNNFETPKDWTDYVWKNMVAKFPRKSDNNVWWVEAGCGRDEYWYGAGLRAQQTEIIMSFGDAWFAVVRPGKGV